MYFASGREAFSCFEELDLVFPGGGIAFDEFHSETRIGYWSLYRPF